MIELGEVICNSYIIPVCINNFKYEFWCQISSTVSEALNLPFPSSVELKQGRNLSPLLFNFFVKSIVDLLTWRKSQLIRLPRIAINYLLYADDLSLMPELKNDFQNSLNTFRYCQEF